MKRDNKRVHNEPLKKKNLIENVFVFIVWKYLVTFYMYAFGEDVIVLHSLLQLSALIVSVFRNLTIFTGINSMILYAYKNRYPKPKKL